MNPYIAALQAKNNDLNLNYDSLKTWLDSRVSAKYANTSLCYIKKYQPLLKDVQSLNLVPESNRNNVIKALILLSKYLGCYDEFKGAVKKYGITMKRQDALQSFLRMFKADGHSDLNQWLDKANSVLANNEKLYLKFTKFTGIRMAESVNSFNLIIKLSKEDKLDEYFDKSLNVLMHFKYPSLFIRRTKNVYISFVSQELVNEITNSQPLEAKDIHNHLQIFGMKSRINELRDVFGSSLIHKGILQQEIDLLQGRIPISIFIRHYWSPKLKDLGTRILQASSQIEATAIKAS